MESMPQIAGRPAESMEDFSCWEGEVHELSLEISREPGAMAPEAQTRFPWRKGRKAFLWRERGSRPS